ncbi:hypothetical protein RchiOBHm_Chr5g0081281 [Rosa chinensis]|uniref:Uncharacterized protein n=1 Tax=Rosa chinensis TaxID=74649 RepID=A0A2P6QMZ6_ROSCH|nr:hypothetical protein RchiOBHm_Chr5g0081281 [Rosa chinensis]
MSLAAWRDLSALRSSSRRLTSGFWDAPMGGRRRWSSSHASGRITCWGMVPRLRLVLGLATVLVAVLYD